MNTEKHIFVAIFSSTCSHCIKFKNLHWDAFKKENNNKIDIVEITLNNNLEELKNIYPSDLFNYFIWFPMFLLFTKSSWNDCLINKQNKLKGIIFNGPIINGIPSKNESMTSYNLKKWIDYELKHNELFNNISIYSKGYNFIRVNTKEKKEKKNKKHKHHKH